MSDPRLNLPKPGRIFITPFAFQKLKLYTVLCPAEISGLGLVELREDRFVVTDVFILPQRVTPADTELEAQHLCEFLSQYIAQGKDPASLKVWWHSHGEMDLDWSETDRGTIEAFPGEYLISLVGNKNGEFVCRLDVFAPSREVIDGLDLVPLEGSEEDADGLEALRQVVQVEINEKVKFSLPIDPQEFQEWVVAFPTDDSVREL